MIVNCTSEIVSQPIFFHFKDYIVNQNIYLKFEGLNAAESVKLKTARFIINGLEKSGKLIKGVSKIIESSSGNLGIALSIICKEKGYGFTCVIDPNILPGKEKRLKLYGANLIKVTQKDDSGGYLATRINTIKELLSQDPNYVWTNQYANQDNVKAHYHETAPEILTEIPKIDYLLIGAGTTGTLMGCANYFKEYSPKTKIIAVDPVGSITFGNKPYKRYIPGIGTSRKPEILDPAFIDQVILVEETDTVKTCRFILKKYGLFLGGSSGSVMYAIKSLQQKLNNNHAVIVGISPDFGSQYQDTIYNDAWILDKYNQQLNY